MIRIDEITTPDALRALAAQWNAVLDACEIRHPFLTHEWITCWWDSFGAGNEMYVLVARRDGGVIGIAPLMKTTGKRRGITFRALEFMANYHSNRSGFILAGDARETLGAFFDHIVTHCTDVDLWLLDFIPAGSPDDLHVPDILRARHVKYVVLGSLTSPYIHMDLPWDAYWAARTSKFRTTIRHDLNHLRRDGRLDVTLYTRENLDTAYAELLHVSRNTWKFKAGTAIASTPVNEHFYRSLAQTAAAQGWLNIWILRSAGVPVAFSYCLAYKGRAMVLKIGFDMACAKDGPGGVLARHVIEHYFNERMTEFDWLGENDPFKLKWADDVRRHHKYLIFTRRPRGRLLYLIEMFAVPAVKKVLLLRRRAPAEDAEG